MRHWRDNGESAKSQNFFRDNSAIKKKIQHKPYTTTGIKTRFYPSNIVYNGVITEDFYNRNFAFDIYVFAN